MRSYVRETHDMGNGRRFITYYSPEDYLFLSLIKFLAFLFILWPLQLIFWGTVFVIKWIFKALFGLFLLPFKLIFRLIFHREDE